jgi:NAD(P)H-binding
MFHLGVLKYKRQAEQLLEASGLPFVLLRPGRLTDGPYTSYDLNTLLQATAGSRQDVRLSAAEDQNGEASRIAVAGGELGSNVISHAYHPSMPGAQFRQKDICPTYICHFCQHTRHRPAAVRRAEAMVQLLSAEDVEGRKFSLVSMEGDGPGQDTAAWRQLFTSAYA